MFFEAEEPMLDSSAGSHTHAGPITLVGVPYAGGNAHCYRPLEACCAPGIALQTLELPGHGRRSSEPLCGSLEALADDLSGQVRLVAAQGRYALFGHSMGALLAYLCALRMRDAGMELPEALFLSASGAPRRHDADGPEVREGGCARHLLPREAFFAMLARFGGCPQEVLAERQLLEYFEPILRADFQAVDTWLPRPSTPLAVPIIAFSGRQDQVEGKALEAWARETSASFELCLFEGGHFYIQHCWPDMAAIMGRVLTGGTADALRRHKPGEMRPGMTEISG